MEITKEVKLLINDNAAVRVLNTQSAKGIPHSIAVNTAMVSESNLISIADIKMKQTASNLKENRMMSILVVKGYESYLIRGTVRKFQTEGLLFDAICDEAMKKGLECRGLWLFEAVQVINQSLFVKIES